MQPRINAAVIPRSRTITESVPETLGPRPSYAFSNRLVGTDAQTDAAGPSLHFGNTPAPPTMSPDSSRKTRGSKASPRAGTGGNGTDGGDQIKPANAKTNLKDVRALNFDNLTQQETEAAALNLAAVQNNNGPESNDAVLVNNSDSAVGPQLPSTFLAPTQVQFLEPTQLQPTMEITQVNDMLESHSHLPDTAAIPATQIQVEHGTSPLPLNNPLDETEQMAIIPETDEASFKDEHRSTQQALPKPPSNTQVSTEKVIQAIEEAPAPPQAPPAVLPDLPPSPGSQPLCTAEEIKRLEEDLRQRWLGSLVCAPEGGSEDIRPS